MREFVDKIIREPFKTSHVTGPVLTRCLFEGHPAWLRSNAQIQAAPNSMQCESYESFICFKWVEKKTKNKRFDIEQKKKNTPKQLRALRAPQSPTKVQTRLAILRQVNSRPNGGDPQ